MPPLDGVRGVAILLVLVWHYVRCQIPYTPKSLSLYVAEALSTTWSGVDLFFVLSGFLIAGILLDHRNTSNFFRVFYLRRVCRILPLYFLLFGLFLCLMATPLFNAPAFRWLFRAPLPLWSYASFTQNFFMGARRSFGPMWLGITWSLAIEEQFYLFIPLLVYVLPRRAFAYVLIAGILAAPIIRCASPGFHAIVYTPWRADSLFSGALLAVLVRWHPFVSAMRQYRRFPLLLLVCFFLGTVVLTFEPGSFGDFHYFWLAGLYSAFVLVAFLGSEPVLTRVLASPVLVWFGQLSYGIYMFHQAISGLIHGLLRHSPPYIHTLYDAGVTLLALCLTLVLATLSYHFFERPLLRFGHRFQYLPGNQGDSAWEALPDRPNQTIRPTAGRSDV